MTHVSYRNAKTFHVQGQAVLTNTTIYLLGPLASQLKNKQK